MTVSEILNELVDKNTAPVLAVVDSVDTGTDTITATTLEDDTPLEGISLATSDQGNFVIYPKVGSVVGIVMRSDLDGWVTLYGEADSIKMGDGTYEGLIKINDLVTKLNTIEQDLNTIKSAIASWIPVASDGGAALKTALSTWYGSNLTLTLKGDIENEKINHGDL